MRKPKVTVGMPTYRRPDTLKRSIEQVLNQTFTDFEFIICDDGSGDRTPKVVHSFKDDRIVFLADGHLGPPHPLNRILHRAAGEYVIILHDHDFFHERLLELSVEALDRYPSAGFVLQGCAQVGEDGSSQYREMLLDLPELNDGRSHGMRVLEDRRGFNSPFHACSMVRHSHHVRAGLFYDIEFGLYADVDLWLRLLQHFDFVYLQRVLFKFTMRDPLNHFLSERDLDVVEWNYSIHMANIRRYCESDRPRLEYLLSNAKSKYVGSIWRSVLKFGSSERDALFSKGLNLLFDIDTSPLRTPLIKLLVYNASLRRVTMRILSNSNRIRRWLVRKRS